MLSKTNRPFPSLVADFETPGPDRLMVADASGALRRLSYAIPRRLTGATFCALAETACEHTTTTASTLCRCFEITIDGGADWEAGQDTAVAPVGSV